MSRESESPGTTGLLPRSVFSQPTIGVLMPALPVTSHLWQEYHRDAPTNVYAGPTVEDRRVVETMSAASLVPMLVAKERLHLCFQECAVATIEAYVSGSQPFYLRWWIEDPFGNIVREHPTFTQAAYNANRPAAKLANGKQGWMWNGRNNAANPVYVVAGKYLSRFEVKDAAGNVVQSDHEPIEAQGDAYRIWVVGQPKPDADLRHELTRAANGGRFLNESGERLARDCWIMVQRGARVDGHIVYLGQGTIEATKVESGDKAGAIATPHSREYKGWIRPNPHGRPADADRIQIEDVGRTDETIRLLNPGGPAPNNPYADTAPNTPVKDGVQAHRGAAWTTTGLSIGCTTASAIQGATPMAPGSIRGRVRSINSEFGSWGNPAAGERVSVEGPRFVNKQTKRNRVADAQIVDDHFSTEFDPPQHPSPVAGHPDEPLHMQPTMQQGAFGGFKGHEIPRDATVDDSPTDKLRIRMILQQYAPGTLYYLYHHAVIFGHTREQVGAGWRLTAWIPNKVIRGWNGNFRNVLVRARCQMAWYIERRVIRWTGDTDESEIVATLNAAGASGYQALPADFIGRPQRTWTPAQPLATGEYYSVFKYKLELKPFVAGNDAWVTESAMADSFPIPTGSAATGGARLEDETLVTNGGRQYIEGRSELPVIVVP